MAVPPVCEPYQDPSVGDLIVRTSDHIEFHVHRRRIADVSPIFSDIFSLPDPPAEQMADKQAVDVSESSAVWSKLLPLVHVDEEPTLSLADIRNLLEASDKYQMAGVKSRMRTHLLRSDVLDENPHAVYALACCGRFEDVAGIAASRTLKLSVCPPNVPEFAYVSGQVIYRLLEYRQKCAVAARGAIEVAQSASLPSPKFEWLCRGCPDSKTCDTKVCQRTSITVTNSSWTTGKKGYKEYSTTHDIRTQWLDYLRNLDRELEHLPHESVACSVALLMPVITHVTTSCSHCSPNIQAEVLRFSQATEKQIKEAVSKVKLVLES